MAATSQAEGLVALTSQVQHLMAALTTASVATLLPPLAPAPVLVLRSAPEPWIGDPECYAGDPESCNPLILNCSIIYTVQPLTFALEGARVAFAVNHLTGLALRGELPTGSSSFRLCVISNQEDSFVQGSLPQCPG